MNKTLKFTDEGNKPQAENLKEKRIVIISHILKDFVECRRSINGYGYFEEMPTATIYANKMGKNQIRQLEKYGIVPNAFIDFLGTMGIKIDRNQFIRDEMTEGYLASILLTGNYSYEGGQAISDAEYIAKKILTSTVSELNKSFRLTTQYGKRNQYKK